MEKEKLDYESPTIEIEELVLEDSIADSGLSGAGLWEEQW